MYDEWKPIYTALVADIMDQMGHRNQSMDRDVRPIHPDNWFAGPAVTLDAVPCIESKPDPYAKIFVAYERMSPGDVVVIATNGELVSGIWGELLSTAARARGVEAVVTDGLVRDVRKMAEMGFGCFCKGFSPLDCAGRCLADRVGEPIICGGVRVHPRDFVVADYDGVVVVPAAIRDEVLRRAQEKLAGENVVRQELEEGRSIREVFDQYHIL